MPDDKKPKASASFRASQPSKPEKPKAEPRKEYVCITPCWHLNKKWRRGERGKFTEEQVNQHFEEVDPLAPPPPPPEDLVLVNPGGGPLK